MRNVICPICHKNMKLKCIDDGFMYDYYIVECNNCGIKSKPNYNPHVDDYVFTIESKQQSYNDIIQQRNELLKTLKEARKDLCCYEINAADAAMTDKRWVGVDKIINQRIKECDKIIDKVESYYDNQA